MGPYPNVGNISRLSCTFTDQSGAPADPTAVTVQVRPPQGSVSTYTPTRDGVGAYHYDLTLSVPGTYWYRFIGTGAVTAESADRSFVVPDASF